MADKGPKLLPDPEMFQRERRAAVRQMGSNLKLRQLALQFMTESAREKYSYNFNWFGVPIIQYPQDVMAIQEVIWKVKPRVILETGIARGGSVLFYSSMLELLHNDGIVIGVDVDIREHNRKVIVEHPLASRIHLVEGSSIDVETLEKVNAIVGDRGPVMVCLDSNHSHSHVLQELHAYSNWVTPGSYLVVFDTVIEHLPAEIAFGKPWGQGNSPATAVEAFLQVNRLFEVDNEIDNKLLITVLPGGFLRRVSGT